MKPKAGSLEDQELINVYTKITKKIKDTDYQKWMKEGKQQWILQALKQ